MQPPGKSVTWPAVVCLCNTRSGDFGRTTGGHQWCTRRLRRPGEGVARKKLNWSMKNSSFSRRKVLKTSAGASIAGLGTGLFGSVSYAESRAGRKRSWDHESDVVVVGSGAAGSAAALFAHKGGASVLMLEKSFLPGGTTAKSGGRIWIPDNFLMRKQGIKDNRENCLKYMARLSYPTLYNPRDRHLGLSAGAYDLIATYYDNASPVINELLAMKALNLEPWLRAGEPMADYYSDLPENRAPMGRALECPLNPELGGRGGAQMVREFQAALQSRKIPLLLEHRVRKLVIDAAGEVIGLECEHLDDAVSIRARKGVAFASGGFTHNPEMLRDYVRGPIFGGCASGNAEGDFVYMATAAGAKLANMGHVWGRPLILEQVVENRETPDGAWLMGDSMIQVNAAGERVTNEMLAYNERNQVHYDWDAVRARYSNLVSFVIYDEQCRQRFGTKYSGIAVVLEPGLNASYVISGQTLDDLAGNIRTRLARLAGRIGGFTLDEGFTETLKGTISRFNHLAEKGVDEDFRRGETLYEKQAMTDFMGDTIAARGPNTSIAPVDGKGPYYCVMICPGTLDTKGGPKINSNAQVVDYNDNPMPGLYGAGNCIGSPAAQAYWSGGATLGLALTFGAIAGRNAAKVNNRGVMRT